jgi:heme/copper-type cytochrome/quinol oxidase subunit 2
MDVRRFVRRPCLALAAIVLMSSYASAQQLASIGPSSGFAFDERFFTVGDHFFAPAEITVSVGKPVRFHVSNGSRDHLHNFLILSHDGALLGGRPGAIYPGQRVEVEWTPGTPGVYLIVCGVCPREEEMIIVVRVV